MVKGKQKKTKKENPVTRKLKEEAARELGLNDEIAARGWANLTSRETGKIGSYIACLLYTS
ncbi:MAG TPA: benzoate transporter, partial [Firmicutes bacterium]|nr:benzoate transporter [Bacillota bacterium]